MPLIPAPMMMASKCSGDASLVCVLVMSLSSGIFTCTMEIQPIESPCGRLRKCHTVLVMGIEARRALLAYWHVTNHVQTLRLNVPDSAPL